ncbi:MAG: hypothetical protein AAGF20_02830 [Pseudomonadota bacterium]
MTELIRRTIGATLLLCGLFLMILLALALIGWLLLGTDVPAIERFVCEHDLTTECVLAKAEARADDARAEADAWAAEVAAREHELAELERRRDELLELPRRLEDIENKTENYVLFAHDNGGRYQVTSGWQYASMLQPGKLDKGWCYFEVAGANSSDRRTIFIAEFGKRLRVQRQPIPDATLQEFGLTQDGLVDLIGRCRWPEGVS